MILPPFYLNKAVTNASGWLTQKRYRNSIAPGILADPATKREIADQHQQRLPRSASANPICAFVMPAIRLIDTRCPASTIFAGWRQSVLPVHLLGLDALLGSVGPVAGDVKLEDDGVVHDPVNRRGGGHGVGKDALPLREDQV